MYTRNNRFDEMEPINKTLELLESLPVEELPDGQKDEIREILKNLKKVEEEAQARIAVTRENDNNPKAFEGDLKIEKMFQVAEERVEELLGKTNDRPNPLFGAIERRLDGQPESSAASDQDEDIAVLGEKMNTVDPISKQPIKKPIKNRGCGHIYDESVITAWLQTEKRADKRPRCPVSGCGNKKTLTQRDLFDFPQYFDLLEAQQKNIVDDDEEIFTPQPPGPRVGAVVREVGPPSRIHTGQPKTPPPREQLPELTVVPSETGVPPKHPRELIDAIAVPAVTPQREKREDGVPSPDDLLKMMEVAERARNIEGLKEVTPAVQGEVHAPPTRCRRPPVKREQLIAQLGFFVNEVPAVGRHLRARYFGVVKESIATITEVARQVTGRMWLSHGQTFPATSTYGAPEIYLELKLLGWYSSEEQLKMRANLLAARPLFASHDLTLTIANIGEHTSVQSEAGPSESTQRCPVKQREPNRSPEVNKPEPATTSPATDGGTKKHCGNCVRLLGADHKGRRFGSLICSTCKTISFNLHADQGDCLQTPVCQHFHQQMLKPEALRDLSFINAGCKKCLAVKLEYMKSQHDIEKQRMTSRTQDAGQTDRDRQWLGDEEDSRDKANREDVDSTGVDT
ncbi:unnamed protein product, partial [Mesorhabditis spiculigera]